MTVLGHTAAGKTAFAAHLAKEIGGEIISADSRQVYRDMDIGTGKDYEDYQVDDQKIPVHLIDILNAGDEYNLYQFKQDFLKVFADITQRELLAIMCGGSGLYLESILRNYQLLQVPVDKVLRKDLESKNLMELEGILNLYGPPHNISDTQSRKRIIRAIEISKYQIDVPDNHSKNHVLQPLVLGIRYDRLLRRKRITERLEKRLNNGMVEEIKGLLQQGVSSEKMDYYGLEYRFVTKYIQKELTYDEMFNKLNTAIHQFAKRQMTYFRGMERRGVDIHWLDGQLPLREKLKIAMDLYNSVRNSKGKTQK